MSTASVPPVLPSISIPPPPSSSATVSPPPHLINPRSDPDPPTPTVLSSDLPSPLPPQLLPALVSISGAPPATSALLPQPCSVPDPPLLLLRFQNNRDLLKVLTRPSTILITFPYKVFRWHNLCHLKEDSCLAPVWLSLPCLPLQCFIPEFLESVGNKIGRFLCFDKATTTLVRSSAVRICVELDLRKPPPQFIWVGLFDGFKQPIVYEKLPKFCNGCHVLGHDYVGCSRRSSTPTPLQSVDQAPTLSGRAPDVRQKASHSQSTHQQGNSALNNLRADPSTQIDPNHPQHHTVPSTNPHDGHRPGTQVGITVPEKEHQSSALLPNPPKKPYSHPGEGCNNSVMAHQSTSLKPPKLPRHLKGKQIRKSVSFGLSSARQQANLGANKLFWDAVNSQVALLVQDRIISSSSLAQAPQDSPFQSSKDPTQPSLPGTSHLQRRSEDPLGTSAISESNPGPSLANNQVEHSPSEDFNSNGPDTYDSEGEEPQAESSHIHDHATDEALTKMPRSSK